jgi:hypothetical protein
MEHLSVGALLGDPGGGSFFAGYQEDMGSRAQGMGISLHGSPVGELGRVLLCQVLVLALETGTSLHGGPMEHMGKGPFTGNSDC